MSLRLSGGKGCGVSWESCYLPGSIHSSFIEARDIRPYPSVMTRISGQNSSNAS